MATHTISRSLYPSLAPTERLAAENEGKEASSEDSQIVEALPAEVEWKAGTSEWLITICLTLVNLVIALDASVLVPTLPVIAVSLHGKATDAFWAGTSYLLASSVVQPFFANLSDIFGRRQILLFSLGIFTVGTVLCCVAQNFTVLLTGRSIQGIGGGGCYPMVQVIITDIIPLRKRPQFIGVTAVAWAIASISGPLIGGLFAQDVTWRWCFYINFPFLAIAIVMAQTVIKLDIARPRLSVTEKVLSVDWVGGFLFISSSCTFLIGITWAGIQYPWASAATIVPIVFGAVGFGATIYWEISFATQPFLRLGLFKLLTINLAAMASFLQGLIMFCLLYYLPFYFETCKGLSPSLAGLSLIPVTAAIAPASIIFGVAMSKLGRYRWALWSGWILITLAGGLLILLDPEIAESHWILIFVFLGIAHGAGIMALIVCIQSAAETSDVAYAAATYMFARCFGMGVGVAVGGTIFQNTMVLSLSALNLPVEVASNAEAFVTTLLALPQDSIERQGYISAYSDSFKRIFEVLTAIAGLGLCLTLGIKNYSMNKRQESEHIVRKRISSNPA